MALIKPKEVEYTSKVGGEEITCRFMIGRYNGLEGLDIIEYVTDILKSGVNPTGTKKGLLRDCMIKMGPYIDAVNDEGNQVSLSNAKIMAAYLPDPEMTMRLMRDVHDYNTFFLNSENLLKQSLSWMDKLKVSVTKTLTNLQATSSAKKRQRTKS